MSTCPKCGFFHDLKNEKACKHYGSLPISHERLQEQIKVRKVLNACGLTEKDLCPKCGSYHDLRLIDGEACRETQDALEVSAKDIADTIDKEILSTLLEHKASHNFTTYSSESSEPFDTQKMMETISMVQEFCKKYPMPVFYFSNVMPEDRYLEGHGIDRLLDCSEYEKGIIISSVWRDIIKKRYPHIKEWVPKRSRPE